MRVVLAFLSSFGTLFSSFVLGRDNLLHLHLHGLDDHLHLHLHGLGDHLHLHLHGLDIIFIPTVRCHSMPILLEDRPSRGWIFFRIWSAWSLRKMFHHPLHVGLLLRGQAACCRWCLPSFLPDNFFCFLSFFLHEPPPLCFFLIQAWRFFAWSFFSFCSYLPSPIHNRWGPFNHIEQLRCAAFHFLVEHLQSSTWMAMESLERLL